MKTVQLNDEQKERMFADARWNKKHTSVRLEGSQAVYRRLILLFEEKFVDVDGKGLECHVDDSWFYRLVKRDEETGQVDRKKPGDSDLEAPCLLLLLTDVLPPTLGEVNDEFWIPDGEYEDTGVKRVVNFPIRSLKNLVFDLYVIRTNSLESLGDIDIWDYIWKEHQWLNIGEERDDETGELIRPGVSFRTRVVNPMKKVNMGGFTDFSATRGSIEIQRVLNVDPTQINESAPISEVQLDYDLEFTGRIQPLGEEV